MALPPLPIGAALALFLALPALAAAQSSPRPLPVPKGNPKGTRLAVAPSEPADGYGHAVVNLGDLDGDGFDDFAVGAPAIEMAEPGHAVAHSGRTGRELWRVRGADPKDEFGGALAAIDWNADGHLDLVVGARRALVDGTPKGCVRIFDGRSGAEFLRLDGPYDLGEFGSAAARIGDLNGDGRADLAVGAPGEDDDRGAVYVFAAGTGHSVRRLGGGTRRELFGWAIAGIGDVDRDGVDDVAVGAPGRDARGPGAGAIVLRSGGSARTLRTVLGLVGGEGLGTALTTVGDLDGDGFVDLAAAAPRAALDDLPDVGRVMLLSTRDGAVLGELRGTRAGHNFGHALVGFDADADGRPDLAVGVPYAENPLEPSRHRPGAVWIYGLATRELISSRCALMTEERHGFALAALRTPDGVDLLVGAPHREETLPPSDKRRKGWARVLPFAER
ncbi:MAG: hypothetical protein GC161_00700 [Planctomycetaceae bacterium]|nr:hypothetical protein [Planctomycetaceae bacterium]